MHRRLKLRRPLAALLALAVLATGCIRAEIAIRVNADGSGTVSVLTAFDRSFMEAFGEDDASGLGTFDLNSLTEIDESELPSGASVEPYEEGDFVGVRVTVPFESGDDVAASIDRIFAGTGGESSPLAGDDSAFRRLVLERDGDGWRFEAEMEISAGELTEGTEGDPLGEAFARLLLGDASFVVRLSLPGEIVSHNADEIGPDGELVWNIDIFGGETRTLSASSDLSGEGRGGGTTIVVAVAALLISVLVVAGVFVARRQRGAAS